ncbi:MAG: outer membrane beta-barrel protein [Bacteroidales bacterium]|nr:outer membrane beta-barrel protein [Bacteroidales bacterium]
MKKVVSMLLCLFLTANLVGQEKNSGFFVGLDYGKTDFLSNSGLSLNENQNQIKNFNAINTKFSLGYNTKRNAFIKLNLLLTGADFQEGFNDLMKLKEQASILYSEIAVGWNFKVNRLTFRPTAGIGLMSVWNNITLNKDEYSFNSNTIGSSLGLSLSYEINKNLSFVSEFSSITAKPKVAEFSESDNLLIKEYSTSERDYIKMTNFNLGLRINF